MRILHLAVAILGSFGVSWAASTVDRDGNPVGEPIPADPRPSERPAESTLAAVLIFNDRDAFLEATSGLTENFEREPWSADCDSGGAAAMAFLNFDVASSPPALKLLRDACFGNHNTTIGGRRYLGADTDLATVSAEVTFTFEPQIHAFGMYVVDLDTAALEIGIGGQFFQVPATGDGGQAFFGIIASSPFRVVTCHVGGEDVDSHYSFDDVTYGTVPPGPVDVPDAAFSGWGRVKASFR